MKKISVLFVLFLSIITFAQTKINFESTSFDEILKKAKSDKKLVFLDAYAEWCGPCKLMDKFIFTDEKVANYFNENFVNARIDMEKGEGRDLAVKYGISSYPSLLFINGEGEIVGRELGYLDANQFLELGTKNNNPKLVSGSMKDELIKDNLDQESLLTFIKINSSTEPILSKQAAERYFSRKKDSTISGDEINALLTFTQSVDDPTYQYFVKNKKLITDLLPEQNYNDFDNYLKLRKIISDNTDEKIVKINREKILQEGKGLVPDQVLEKILNTYSLGFYSANQNYSEYEKVALDYYQSNNQFNPKELLMAANIFNEHVTNPKSLKVATQWIEQVVMSSENFDTTSLLAQLYSKVGKKEEAKMFAEMALEFAEQENKDSAKVKEILNIKN